MFRLISGLLEALSVFSCFCIYLYFEYLESGYYLTVFFPLIFIVISSSNRLLFKVTGATVTCYGLLALSFARYVLVPLLILVSENPGFHYLTNNSELLNEASMIIIIEGLTLSVLLSMFSLLIQRSSFSKVGNMKPKSMLFRLYGTQYAYILVILASLLLYFFFPGAKDLFNFFVIPITDSGVRIGDINDDKSVLIRQIIQIGLLLSFAITAVKFFHSWTPSRGYSRYLFILLLFVCILNIGLIIGERRTAQIYTMLLLYLILLPMFPRQKRSITVATIGTGLFVIIFMSIYKFYGAFQFESYSSALTNTSLSFDHWSRLFQSYFFGPQNVAAFLEFSYFYEVSPLRLFNDIWRSIFLLNRLALSDELLVSQAFNKHIYGSDQLVGHVVSSGAYTYGIIGVVFLPILTFFNITVALFFEKRFSRTRYVDIKLVYGLVMLRFATNPYVISAPLISYATIVFGTLGLVVIVSALIRRALK